jgi:hypothetical protein
MMRRSKTWRLLAVATPVQYDEKETEEGAPLEKTSIVCDWPDSLLSLWPLYLLSRPIQSQMLRPSQWRDICNSCR